MNRRSFLLGLLSTTAAPVIARAVPLVPFSEPSQTQLAIIEMLTKANEYFIKELSQQMTHTIIYGTDELPRQYTGIHLNVPCYEVDELPECDRTAIYMTEWRKING